MSRLSKFYDQKLAQLGEPPGPMEMGVTPPRRHGFVDIAAIKREIRATREKVNRLLRKYEEED